VALRLAGKCVHYAEDAGLRRTISVYQTNVVSRTNPGGNVFGIQGLSAEDNGGQAWDLVGPENADDRGRQEGCVGLQTTYRASNIAHALLFGRDADATSVDERSEYLEDARANV
jgi:hypothetical protein